MIPTKSTCKRSLGKRRELCPRSSSAHSSSSSILAKHPFAFPRRIFSSVPERQKLDQPITLFISEHSCSSHFV
ncbi:repressor protein [Pseudozyma hubeiensis SY62]|uniref:Repressor protein n=1 Tax=Pseudozyma hubeiensis (strain SY62) TaxID=1305764 RepID=R9P8B8_PSEHS|nr:repressor protein [Pseudozyma hubeiensis SY62]GAC97616.1 repressor protein [Pseudozyma hubeiensis SY62]